MFNFLAIYGEAYRVASFSVQGDRLPDQQLLSCDGEVASKATAEKNYVAPRSGGKLNYWLNLAYNIFLCVV